MVNFHKFANSINKTHWLVPLAIVWLAAFLRLSYVAVANTAWPNSASAKDCLQRVSSGANSPVECAPQFENVDAQGYHWLAVNLVERGIFSMNTEPPFRSDNVRAPLYPLLVAGFYVVSGPDPRVVALFQAVLDAATVAVTFRLGKCVADWRAGVLAALLCALAPASWRFCNELLTEITFGLLLTASLWMFARYILGGRNRDALWCGLLSGASILCKPNVQFLPLVLLGILIRGLVTRKRATGAERDMEIAPTTMVPWWQGATIVAVTIVVMLLPWMARNRLVFGEWFYTRTFDDNLAHVSAVATLAHVNGESVAPWTPRWEAIYDEVIAQAAAQYAWSTNDPSALSARERDLRLQQITAVAVSILRTYPVDFIASHTQSWLWSFLPQDHKFWYTLLSGQSWGALPLEGDAFGRALSAAQTGNLSTAADILVRERLLALPPLALALWTGWGVSYLVTTILFFAGTLRLRPRVLALVFVATVFYVTFLPGPISHIRFRLPVVPVILLLAVVGARWYNHPYPRRI